jgi:alpha-L-rhamnosidase
VLAGCVASSLLAVAAPNAAGASKAAAAATAVVAATALETDAAPQPLGIDDLNPRLSWRLSASRRAVLQSAYQVLVASSPALLASGAADVWDSGKVTTRTPWVDYSGPALASLTRYYWTVRVWDETGNPTAFAAATWFETAFMSPNQWSAQWIKGPLASCASATRPGNCPAPLLRTDFDVTKPVARARLYASGLSYGVYYIDGRRVGDEVLDPGITDYTVRAFYVTHDVTALLQPGWNAIGAELGRGFMGMVGPTYSGYPGAWKSEPKLRLELHIAYQDGTSEVIASGPAWKTTDGPRRFDDPMLGETYDARRAVQLGNWTSPNYDDSSWTAATVTTAPAGVLVAQNQEPIRPFERLPFQSVTQVGPGDYLFDLGENVVGNAILYANLADGQRIELAYGEKLANGHVDTSGNPSFNGDPVQVDYYTSAGGGDHWRPEFTYKGFQYVEVTGLTSPPPLSMLTAEVWHSDVAPVGSWESSNALANRIVGTVKRSILSNLFSQPTDTPIYEKSGYTGDGQLMAPSDSYLFDTQRFITKWSTDIDENLFPDGQMAWVAPDPHDPSTDQTNDNHQVTPGWDAALFTVPDTDWRYYGDERPELAALPEMKTYNTWIAAHAPGYTITGIQAPAPVQSFSVNGLGDWSPATAEPSMGISLDSTAWYYDMEQILARTAVRAGDTQTANSAAATAANISTAFNLRFFDPVTGTYKNDSSETTFSQHQNAIALGLGLVPSNRVQSTGDAIAADVSSRGNHLNTGIMGTRFLWDALTQTGHVDTAWAAATQETYPSYGYWLDTLGFTGLGENWEANTRSHNHHMFGTALQWLFEDIAGYQPTKPGFEEIQFKPYVPSSDLDWVNASTNTVRGMVAASWRKSDCGLNLDVTVPANATGTVAYPGTDPTGISEIGTGTTYQPANSAPGVTLVGVQDGRIVYRVGSGTYQFRCGSQPTVNYFEDDDSQIAYEPGWHTVSDADASSGHFRVSNGKGLSFSFTTGASTGSLRYAYATSTKGGSADLYLDGSKVGTVSYQGSKGSLHAPVFDASTDVPLSGAGSHTLELRNVRGPAYVDGFSVADGSSQAQPSSNPSATTTSSETPAAGAILTDTITVPSNAQSVSVLGESTTLIPYKLVLLDPAGNVLATGIASANGIASVQAPVSVPGTYSLQLVNLGLRPVQIWTAATPQVQK